MTWRNICDLEENLMKRREISNLMTKRKIIWPGGKFDEAEFDDPEENFVTQRKILWHRGKFDDPEVNLKVAAGKY